MKVVTKVLIYDASGHVLVLVRSSTHPKFAHHPDLPGGIVDHGETYLAAAVREVEEESGIHIAVENLTEVYRVNAENDFMHIIYVARLKKRPPSIAISWEHETYSWKTEEEVMATPVPSRTDPSYQTALRYLELTRPAR